MISSGHGETEGETGARLTSESFPVLANEGCLPYYRYQQECFWPLPVWMLPHGGPVFKVLINEQWREGGVIILGMRLTDSEYFLRPLVLVIAGN